MFLRSLIEKEQWDAGVSFCAYLLPRREAVWWGCQSLRRLKPELSQAGLAPIEAAEAWVREPEDEIRREALRVGMRSDTLQPAAWMALAAGWSGGSIIPPEYGVLEAGPEQTARAVRAGILIAMTQIPTEQFPELVKPCLDGGIALASGSPGKA